MFGKKKSVMVQVKDFHCGLCGIDCVDQVSFERHVVWVHPGTTTLKTGKEVDLTVSEKMA